MQGTALFRKLSKINHSCTPNAYVSFCIPPPLSPTRPPLAKSEAGELLHGGVDRTGGCFNGGGDASEKGGLVDGGWDSNPHGSDRASDRALSVHEAHCSESDALVHALAPARSKSDPSVHARDQVGYMLLLRASQDIPPGHEVPLPRPRDLGFDFRCCLCVPSVVLHLLMSPFLPAAAPSCPPSLLWTAAPI